MRRRIMHLIACTPAAATLLTPGCLGAPAPGMPGWRVAPQAYRAATGPVQPTADGTILCEAEEFAATTGTGWRAGEWGRNYYAATFANTFLSRKAFLGAPAQCETSAATITLIVPTADRYLVLVRYEAAYRFETQFRLRLEQQGKLRLDHLYGARANTKIWAFRQKLKKELAWSWGAVENVVWEGHDVAVDLQPGPATLTLIASPQPEPAARRNVDLVMLTRDEAQVKMRIEKENYLPLDGMLTQAGDVFARVRVPPEAAPLRVVFNPCREHSPYWIHMRRWKPMAVTGTPGKTSEWIDVGGLLDTLNDGQWKILAKPAVKGEPVRYTLEFAAHAADGAMTPLARFPDNSGDLDLAFQADTRYTGTLRKSARVLYDLLAALDAVPIRGRVPTRTLIYGYTFDARPQDAAYTAARKRFTAMFALHATGTTNAAPNGYMDVRHIATDKLAALCADLGDQAANIACVSLGDEIGLPRPAGDARGQPFIAFLKAQGLQVRDVDPTAGDDWRKIAYAPAAATAKPMLYYWSRRYDHAYGIGSIKTRTDILRRCLPNAGIGANFSPHQGGARHSYLGEVHKWVTLFRTQAMTMPWSEDYIWGVPVGSPQMNFINLDLFRAGVRHLPEAKIQYYVMPHWPGNTPRMWRRQFYGDISHGMKIVNLFEFRPVQAAYTENHVTHVPMYLAVRRAFAELGRFEDLVQDGHVRLAKTALWFSETGDIWRDNTPPFGAAKRALYLNIRHAQAPLDFVIEADALDGTLADYDVLYLTDRHVDRAAAVAIAAWVRQGGRLFATAGAGMRDEADRPNEILQGLFGIREDALLTPASSDVAYIKQDLPFATPIVMVKWRGQDLPAFGAISHISTAGAEVLAAFADGKPAIVRQAAGKGSVMTCAFLPSLSAFAPAIPRRPVDRGTTDDAMAHFIPTAFDAGAQALIAAPLAPLHPPVRCSEPLVESTVIDAANGMLVPLVNWSAGPIRGLTVTLDSGRAARRVALASGAPLTRAQKGTELVLTLDLDVADAIILR